MPVPSPLSSQPSPSSHPVPSQPAATGKPFCSGIECSKRDKPKRTNIHCGVCAGCCKLRDEYCSIHAKTGQPAGRIRPKSTLIGLVFGDDDETEATTNPAPSQTSTFAHWYPGPSTNPIPSDDNIDPALLAISETDVRAGASATQSSLAPLSRVAQGKKKRGPAVDLPPIVPITPGTGEGSGIPPGGSLYSKLPPADTNIYQTIQQKKIQYAQKKRAESAQTATAVALQKQITIRVWNVS